MLKIKKSDLAALFARISEQNDLFLPVKSAGKTNFAAWDEAANVDLDTLKTVKSPKDTFFPQSENLYSCSREDGKIKIDPAKLTDAPFVIFGIRACDVRAIDVLDRVFLSDPVDSYYAARREHGILVSYACHNPDTSCFCKAFGIDAAAPAGDVVTWMVGDELYWEAKTEKGEALTAQVRDLLTEGDAAVVEAEQVAIRAIIEKLPNSNLSLEGWGAEAADARFDSPIWEQLYKPCLACGTCTFVCPTCQCYDIKDYTTGNGVQRFRCWDSCMYSDFTMMAHGTNRPTQKERFRQRFMHKLVYFPANNDGVYGCVGCGRCLAKCPISMNIVKVAKTLKEGQ